MRAVVVEDFGPPEVMQVADLPDPRPPRRDEILVAVGAAGVNPVDTYVRSGVYAALPTLPYTPGSDLAGTVVAAGDAVEGLAPGDRVYASATVTGAYAALALCPAAAAHPLPPRLSFAQGAALGVPYATACRALFPRGSLASGERVLVRGASGGVGLAAVQLAAGAGAIVTGTAGTRAGCELVIAQGGDAAFDHRAADVDDRLLDGSVGLGFDLIVEMLASENLGRDLRLLAARGRLVVVGSRGTVTLDPRDLMQREGEVVAMLLPNATPEERSAIDRMVADGIAAGTIDPVVDVTLPLERAAEAHTRVMGAGHHGKIVLEP